MSTTVAGRDRHEAIPPVPNGTALLLLAGSSGRVESARADLLAAHGVRVRAIRWFGGAGQRPAPHEVPLELFARQLDGLRREADRVVVLGTSFGSEAALLSAALFPVDGVIAVAPSSVTWSGFDGRSWSSHWTVSGSPVPAVPFAPDWEPRADPPAFRSLYEESLRRFPAEAERARIPVERIRGEVLLVAGGDDLVWPSSLFAARIAEARTAHGLTTTVVEHPDAGHRLLLPGEEPATGGVSMARGGTPAADAALGEAAWPEVRRMLGIT
ncbi:acyl-CoA thioester hydrolase/BAAT C-terminal domain-containing protein [Microbacterium sp.]|uniref:acyl-CoA thioester hydrolase/BAAT C-terminal domain-containing protein n=1 Tax=Microbacterium sp. TaxID=51671 RepID=UPI0033414024